MLIEFAAVAGHTNNLLETPQTAIVAGMHTALPVEHSNGGHVFWLQRLSTESVHRIVDTPAAAEETTNGILDVSDSVLSFRIPIEPQNDH